MKLTNKQGNEYFAAGRVDEIVKKAYAAEHELPGLLAKICDEYCMYPQVLQNQDALDEKCGSCPMNRIMEVIE